MPRIKRKTRLRHEWGRMEIEQLKSGQDWFGEGFGNVFDLRLEDRGKWPLPEVREAMEQCWLDCRDDLLAEATGPLFGQLVFDEGISGIEALDRIKQHTQNGE